MRWDVCLCVCRFFFFLLLFFAFYFEKYVFERHSRKSIRAHRVNITHNIYIYIANQKRTNERSKQTKRARAHGIREHISRSLVILIAGCTGGRYFLAPENYTTNTVRADSTELYKIESVVGYFVFCAPLVETGTPTTTTPLFGFIIIKANESHRRQIVWYDVFGVCVCACTRSLCAVCEQQRK